MNNSETHFELDIEEATHSHPLSPIVILSVVCTLKGTMSICVNAHCLMLEVLRYIALNALNTVQKIKAMSKMLKIDKSFGKLRLRAFQPMYIEDYYDL